MSDFEKQLNKQSAGFKLTAAEKRELKARVVSYMEYHPRREQVAQEKAQAYIESQPYTILNFHNVYLRTFVGVFAVFMVVFVPSLAERAVPGDVLYPIKVRVNEEIRGTLTFSAADKVAWETELLSRRISEVRLLADEGKLTEEVETAAAEAVKAHAEAAQDGINKLKGTDAEEAALAEVAFESALDVQTVVLDAEQSETGETESTKIAVAVRNAKETMVATKSTVAPSYEKILARVEQQTTRAYELFKSLEDTASDEERAEIERRLQDIGRAILLATGEPVEIITETEPEGVLEEVEEELEELLTEESDDTAEGTDEAEEVVEDEEVTEPETEEVAVEEPAEMKVPREQQLLKVLADIQKLISFMTDIDVRATVELDKLVPVVPTDDERQSVINATISEANSLLADIEKALAEPEDVDAGVIEKIEVGQEMLKGNVARLTSETEPMALDDKEQTAQTMADLIIGVRNMITPILEGTVKAPEPVVEDKASTTDEVTGGESASSTKATSSDEVADEEEGE